MTTHYARHPDLRLTVVENEGVVLHLGSRRYFSVNETGVSLLNALKEQRTLEELVVVLTDEYDVTAEEAAETARTFLDQCVEARLLSKEDR